jgi:hypothetical protein
MRQQFSSEIKQKPTSTKENTVVKAIRKASAQSFNVVSRHEITQQLCLLPFNEDSLLNMWMSSRGFFDILLAHL